MSYVDFIETVEQVAAIPRQDAERAAQAALQTLGERLAPGETRDLAEELPPELAPWIRSTDEAQPFGVDEFLDRLARREGIAPSAAERHAIAVFAALGRTVSRDEIEDMAAELPRDYGGLIQAAREDPAAGGSPPPVPSMKEIVRRIAERAGITEEAARRTAVAVAEMLGERISGGQVEDLALHLPGELQAALERGSERTRGAAVPLSLDEFLRGIAEREGVSTDVAKEHARAAFAVLKQVVPEKEWSDTIAQLPFEYRTELTGA